MDADAACNVWAMGAAKAKERGERPGWGRLLAGLVIGLGVAVGLGFGLGGAGAGAQCGRSHGFGSLGSGSGAGGGPDGGNGRRDLNLLIAEQLDAELQSSPTLATWLGDHSSDDRLDDVHVETSSREMARLDSMVERLRRLGEHQDELTEAQRLDLQLLAAHVEAKRLELVELRPLERNPLYYTNLMAFGLDSLIGPNLMSLAGMRALRGRLGAVVVVCREAQRNLKNPPEVWTRRATEVAQMTRDFVALLLPRVLANVTLPDPSWPALLDDVNHEREAAQRALDDFIGWLGRDLQPRSKGDWWLPRDRFYARLRAAEMLDVPLDTLQTLVEFEHRETRRRFDDFARRVSGQTNASASASSANLARLSSEALRAVEEEHSKPEELMRAAEAALDRAVELTAAQKFVTLPSSRPQVTEMPAYRFGYVMLSMPALLEPERPAQFYIDPVDQSWKDRKRISDHMRLLNRSQLLLSALHEVIPGHYTQQMVTRHQASSLSPIRLRTLSTAFLEGWSHYAEKSLVQTLPGGAPANDRTQLLALRIELLRLGRLVAALRLHAPPPGAAQGGGLARTEEAVHFFVEECYLDEYAARREAERLTYDPLFALGALGQLQLQQLRADYQAEQGSRYSPQAFHDLLLAQGSLPVVALRRLLLLHPGPSLLPPPEPPPGPLSNEAAER